MADVTLVIKARNEAQAALNAVKGDLQSLAQAAQGVGGQLKQAGKALTGAGVGISAGITAPVTAIGTAALLSAADFEQAMNVMQQVSGATEGQMASLQAQALQLGAETSFSAGEAAQAMLELSKAGLSASEVSAAIGGTLDLAAAGGLGLAQAAEISANAVNVFGLGAADTVAVANMLAAAANASSVEVTDLAQGMQMAGAVFASSGQSIDSLTTALALMGNAGIKGSDAGTSLKTMLMRLAAPTNDAAAVLGDLGVAIYNTDGSMRSFEGILGDLTTATSGLTDEQRNMALTTIFGADAIRAVNILTAAGVTGWDNMASAIGTAGAASAVAEARMKGISGAIEYVKGSIDSFLIGTMLPFADSISGALRAVGDMVTAFGQLPEPVKNAALGFTLAAAAVGPLLIGLGMATSAIGAALPVIAALVSPIGLVIAAIVALGVAWATNFGGIQQIAAAAWAGLQPTLQTIATTIATAIPLALATAQAAWDQLPATLATVQAAFAGFIAAAQPIMAQVGAVLAPAFERVQTAFAGVGTSVGQLTPHFEGLLAAVQNMGTTLQPIVMALATALGVTLVVAASAGTNFIAAAISRLPGIVGPMIAQVTATINMISTTVSGVAGAIAAIATGDWAGAWESLKSIVTGFETFLQSTWTNVTTMLGNVGGAIGEAVTNTLTDLGLTAAAETVQSIIAAIGQLKADIESLSVSDILQPLLEWQWPTFPSIPDVINSLVSWDWPSFPDLPAFLTTLVSWDWPQFPGMPGWLERLLSWQWPAPPDVGGAAAGAAGAVNDAIGGAVGGIWNAVTGGGNQLGTSYAPGGWTWVGEAGRELVRLPRGAEVVPNRKSEEMAAIGAGVTVSVGQMVVQSEMDIYTMAYRLRDVMRRR
ncbi:MAG TPA: phage tail tape measure protein [Chloroflexi bacterium]|nr:phage tail tape measure protein [Chloroflexota bacterium]